MIEWQPIAFGHSNIVTLRSVSLNRRICSIWAYLKTGILFRIYGFSKAKDILQRLRDDFQPLDIDSLDEMVMLARQELVYMRIFGRLVGEDCLCLARSISLTAGLIALGLPAQLVLGKPVLLIDTNYEFHAWTELNDIPINDRIIVKKSNFTILKYPDWSKQKVNPKNNV